MNESQNTKTTRKKPGRKRKQTKSRTSSTAKEDSAALASAMEVLAPLLEFHKSSEEAEDNDIRIFWDVRILRGKGDAFAHTKGSSSVPGALSPKMLIGASAMIQKEIVDKVVAPLTLAFQEAAEAGSSDAMERLSSSSMHSPRADIDAPGGDKVLGLAADDEGDEDEEADE